MKTFTNYIKTFALIFALGYSALTKAQSCSANFIFSYQANGGVTFTSTSIVSNSLTTTYYWNFGNNTTFSATGVMGMGAFTTYSTNAPYVVTLFIMQTAPSCSSAIQFTVNPTNAGGCALNANFGYTQGSNGLVNFNNTTTGTISGVTYAWNFGDGSPASTAISPIHNYPANGTYTVTLVATNNGTCTNTQVTVINVNSFCTLNASFTTTLGANGLVNFASTSTGTVPGANYFWNFGDGSSTVGGPTISHTYANGNYSALLIVMNSSVNPSCADSSFQAIAVTNNTCFINSGFTFSVGSNGLVSFFNTSTGTTSSTSYTWNFGNGFTSNATNPTLTYLSGGVYTVTLLASNSSNCNSNQGAVVSVTTIPCVANANFSVVPTGTLQFWNAIPANMWNVANATWSWGDGSSSSSLFASHQYSTAGMYNICLTVTASCGATASACASYSIFKPTPAGAIININVVQTPLQSIDNSNPVGISLLQRGAPVYELYPNPSTGTFNLKIDGLNSDKAVVTVYNVVGNLLHSATVDTGSGKLNQEINLNNASTGVYFVQIQSGDQTFTRKLIINK